MLDSLNNTIFKTDSLSYYRESFITPPDNLQDSTIRQSSPEAVYGRYSTLLAPVKNENRLSHLVETPLWEGWHAIGILFIFLLFFNHIAIYFRKGFSTLFSFRTLQKQYNENSLLMRNIRQVLLFFSLFIVAFCIHLLLLEYTENITVDRWLLYLIIAGAIFAYFLLKSFILWLIGVISKSSDEFAMLNYSRQLYVIACSILLLPVSIILLLDNGYTTRILIVAGVICGLGFICYFFRSFQIFYKAKFSIFFWFLYLCTFEIAPFLALYRFLLGN